MKRFVFALLLTNFLIISSFAQEFIAHVGINVSTGAALEFNRAFYGNYNNPNSESTIDRTSKAGIIIGIEHFFDQKISGALTLDYYFPHEDSYAHNWYHNDHVHRFSVDMDSRVSFVNLDVKYYFYSKEAITAYGLAGLGFENWNWSTTYVEDRYKNGFFERTESIGAYEKKGNKTGLNLGVGLLYSIQKNISLNAALRVNSANSNVNFSTGIAFQL